MQLIFYLILICRTNTIGQNKDGAGPIENGENIGILEIFLTFYEVTILFENCRASISRSKNLVVYGFVSKDTKFIRDVSIKTISRKVSNCSEIERKT